MSSCVSTDLYGYRFDKTSLNKFPVLWRKRPKIIGLGVDAASGAINEYPHSFQIPMTQAAPTTQFAPLPPPSARPH